MRRRRLQQLTVLIDLCLRSLNAPFFFSLYVTRSTSRTACALSLNSYFAGSRKLNWRAQLSLSLFPLYWLGDIPACFYSSVCFVDFLYKKYLFFCKSFCYNIEEVILVLMFYIAKMAKT